MGKTLCNSQGITIVEKDKSNTSAGAAGGELGISTLGQ